MELKAVMKDLLMEDNSELYGIGDNPTEREMYGVPVVFKVFRIAIRFPMPHKEIKLGPPGFICTGTQNPLFPQCFPIKCELRSAVVFPRDSQQNFEWCR